jgi:hypothetical protein
VVGQLMEPELRTVSWVLPNFDILVPDRFGTSFVEDNLDLVISN